MASPRPDARTASVQGDGRIAIGTPAVTGCCAPDRGPTSRADATGGHDPVDTSGAPTRGALPDDLLDIPGGSFRMGAIAPVACDGDGEGPLHVVELTPFRLAAHAVTNEQFAGFVDATGHVTAAEQFGWSFVFAGHLPDDFEPTRAVAQTPWWRQVLRCRLAPPGRPAVRPRRSRPPPRRARLVGRRPGLLPLAGHPPADRGGVGAGGPRWARGPGVPVGRRARAGRRPRDERLPGCVPRRGHRSRRVHRHRARRRVRPERLRGLQHDRQRLGVVQRLVRRRLLPPQRQARSRRPGDGRGAGDARRLVPVPRLVLPPLPGGGAQRQLAGQLDRQPRLPGGREHA